ncbi:hypothetical protein FRC04_004011 [Tulasnella sp. 424]|nr:hypothetical protein FRC04_004011 [Tulasnella sp. 424]
MELSTRDENEQTTLSPVNDFYAAYGIIPDDSTVGRTGNIVSLLLSLTSVVSSAVVMSVYLTAPPSERNNLRMKMLFGLFVAHFFAALTLVFLLLFALAGAHPRSGTLLCQFLAVVVQLWQWSEYLWTVTLAWVTYCIIVDPLSIITQNIEQNWRYIPPLLYTLAVFFSVLQAGLYGTDYIGGFCYSHSRSRKIWNELSVFGPRLLVCIVISSYYILTFCYIRRPRPAILEQPIQLTPDPSSQSGATTSTGRPRSRRRNTVFRVAMVLDPSEPTPEPRGTPYPVGRLPTPSTPSLGPIEPERRHNIENIRISERMRDGFITVSRWSASTIGTEATNLDHDASQAMSTDTGLSQGTSASSGAPLTREHSTRPMSATGSLMNRISSSFLGWTGWNIGDPTPGFTTPQQRRVTMSPRSSQVPELVASSSGVSHSVAMDEPPNFSAGSRIRQRTAPGTDLLNIPNHANQSHSRSESYPSRSPSPNIGGMTPSQSGPARVMYPPLSTRTPSSAWAAANAATNQDVGSSNYRSARNSSGNDGPAYDYAPARRTAQQIAPVFLIFPLSYMLISTVGLVRVAHTLSTNHPNPWFHTVSRWTLLVQAPIDAITLLYAARRLGKRLRGIVADAPAV